MIIFKLPDLGEGLPDATIREWYVSPGDQVKTDQPLVSMETAKALVDVPSPYCGTISKCHGKPGDTIDTGQPLIEFTDKNIKKPSQENPIAEKSHTVVGVMDTRGTVIQENTIGTQVQKPTSSIKATPAVRFLAKELGVDLKEIKPSGSQITREDVKSYAKVLQPKQQTLSFPGKPEKLSGLRRAMVQTMSASHQAVVPVTITDDADITNWPDKTDITVRIIRALCNAVSKVPAINSFYDDRNQDIYKQPNVHLGLAVDTEQGLYVPVLKNCNNRTDEALRTDINRFKTQAQSHSLATEDLKDGTLILSNFGTHAGQYATPILLPPMVAIVGIGRAREKIIPINNKPAVRKILPLSVTVDHRAITGGEVSNFLGALIKALTGE